MDINFNCGKCGQGLAVDETGAGVTVQCPTCSQEITVPVARSHNQLAATIPITFLPPAKTVPASHSASHPASHPAAAARREPSALVSSAPPAAAAPSLPAGRSALASFAPAPSAVPVVVTEVRMPMGALMKLMVKWAIASIPAWLILAVVFWLVRLLLGGMGRGH